MQEDLSFEDGVRVTRIREALLSLPLVYSTNRSEADLQQAGILPFSQRPEGYSGNSGDLDKSLGLTDYVFMNWGVVEKSSGHGRNHMLIDTKLLFSPATVVTPNDINHLTINLNPFEVQPEKKQELIRNSYFAKMVTGSDWLEIVSRRILRQLTTQDTGLVIMGQDCALGEVKHFGVVGFENFGRYVTPADEHDYWKWQVQHGFLPGPVQRAFPHPTNDYDVLPEQLGVSLADGQAFWKQLLEV